MPIVLGIDPGLRGGLAIVKALPNQSAVLLACIDVPVRADRLVDGWAVINFLQGHSIDAAFIERAQAMPSLPDQHGKRRAPGSSSTFNYGQAVGRLEMCVEGLDIPLKRVESRAWKKIYGLSSKGTDGRKLAQPEVKEQSRQKALRLFANGQQFFARKSDHNRAESALIANYGRFLLP